LHNSKNKTIVTIPLIVRSVIVGIQPGTIVVPIRAEKIGIAVRIVWNATLITALWILSELNLIRDLKSPSTSHQVSSFFEVPARNATHSRCRRVCIHHAIFNRNQKYSGVYGILDSEARNRNRLHIFLLPFLL